MKQISHSFLILLLFTIGCGYSDTETVLSMELPSSPDLHSIQEDIQESLIAPNLLNITQLEYYDYHENISQDSSFEWRITSVQQTDNFFVTEGDKILVQLEEIQLLISENPSFYKTEPQNWGLLYVNEIMARYPADATHARALYKYLQPIGLNLVENFTSDYYLTPAFLDYYAINFNYTSDFVADYYGQVFNYTEKGFFYYLENSPFINQSLWIFEDDTITYQDEWITQQNNRTQIEITYQRETGLMNELHYQTKFINGSGYFAGASISFIRLNEDGSFYNYTPTETTTIYLTVPFGVIFFVISIRKFFRRKRDYRLEDIRGRCS